MYDLCDRSIVSLEIQLFHKIHRVMGKTRDIPSIDLPVSKF